MLRLFCLHPLWIVLFLAAAPGSAVAQANEAAVLTTHVQGTVRDAFGLPVAGAIIELPDLPAVAAVASDANGAFSLRLDPGRHRFLVRRLDHENWARTILVEGTTQPVRVVLRARPLSMPPVRVSGVRSPSPALPTPDQYRIEADAVESKIGSFEDVMRSVQELPGVGSASDLHSEVYVRGSNSSTNAVYLDGIEILFPFHMLGFNSIFSPGVIERVDFFTGTAPVEYGGATGGVLSIQSRGARPRDDGWTMGVSYLSGQLQASGGDRTRGWSLSLRRSYHDKLIGWLDPGAGRQVPTFYDGMLRLRWQPHRDHLVVGGVLAAGDGVALDSPEAQAQQLDFFGDGRSETRSFGTDGDALTIDNRVTMGSLYWRALLDANAYLETTLGIVPQYFRFSLLGSSNERVSMDARTLSMRQTLTWKGGAHRLRAGWQLQRVDATSDVAAYASILNLRESNSTLNLTTLKDRYDFATRQRRDISALYASDTWELWPRHFEFDSGIRLQHDGLTRESTISPQVALSWLQSDRWRLRAAWGVSQAPRSRAMEIRPTADGHTLRSERAVETSLGAVHRWSTQLRAGITGYTKRMSNLVYESEPAYYDNGSVGRAKGVESWLEYEPRDSPLHFTAQYTWAHVLQRDAVAWRRTLTLGDDNTLHYGAEPEPSYWYSPIQDQRHNLNLVSRYSPGSWEFGARLEVASGRPYSAIVGVLEDPEDVFLVVEGKKGNARLPSYHRLDLRVTRNFGSAPMRWSIFAEVLNATGANNVFQLRYDWTYSRRYTVNMLPTLPTLGVEARF